MINGLAMCFCQCVLTHDLKQLIAVLGSPCSPSVTCYTQYATCDTGVCVCPEEYTDTNGNTEGGDCSAGEQNAKTQIVLISCFLNVCCVMML